jgi:curved DNA-binding protein CbpA
MIAEKGQDISHAIPLSEDLYARLGASRHMTHAQLKRQYWRTARRFHPDLHQAAGEDKVRDYGELFKKIAEAWDILGDAEKRKIYDETGQHPTVRAPRSSPWATSHQAHANQQMWHAFENIFVQGAGQPAAFGKIFQLQHLQRLAAFLYDPGCQALFRKIIHGQLPVDLDPDVRFMAAGFAAQVPYAPTLHQSVLELALQFKLRDEQVTELIKRVIHATLSNVRTIQECLPGLEHHLIRALAGGQPLTGAQRTAIIRAVGALAQQSPRIRLLLWQEMDRQGIGEASHVAAVTVLLEFPQQQSTTFSNFCIYCAPGQRLPTARKSISFADFNGIRRSPRWSRRLQA